MIAKQTDHGQWMDNRKKYIAFAVDSLMAEAKNRCYQKKIERSVNHLSLTSANRLFLFR